MISPPSFDPPQSIPLSDDDDKKGKKDVSKGESQLKGEKAKRKRSSTNECKPKGEHKDSKDDDNDDDEGDNLSISSSLKQSKVTPTLHRQAHQSSSTHPRQSGRSTADKGKRPMTQEQITADAAKAAKIAQLEADLKAASALQMTFDDYLQSKALEEELQKQKELEAKDTELAAVIAKKQNKALKDNSMDSVEVQQSLINTVQKEAHLNKPEHQKESDIFKDVMERRFVKGKIVKVLISTKNKYIQLEVTRENPNSWKIYRLRDLIHLGYKEWQEIRYCLRKSQAQSRQKVLKELDDLEERVKKLRLVPPRHLEQHQTTRSRSRGPRETDDKERLQLFRDKGIPRGTYKLRKLPRNEKFELIKFIVKPEVGVFFEDVDQRPNFQRVDDALTEDTDYLVALSTWCMKNNPKNPMVYVIRKELLKRAPELSTRPEMFRVKLEVGLTHKELNEQIKERKQM